MTLEHSSKICRQAYPPGKHFTVPQWPDVEEVNRRGDFALEYSRLAYIDGDRDPWRYCVSHLFLSILHTDGRLHRVILPQGGDLPLTSLCTLSLVSPPTLVWNEELMADGVHHYDENGLTDHSKEPSRIRDVHAFEISFITEWIDQFKEAKGK